MADEEYTDEKSVAQLQESQDAAIVGSAYYPGNDEIVYGGVGTSSALQIKTPVLDLIRKEVHEEREFDAIKTGEVSQLRRETMTVMIREAIGDTERKADIVDIGLTVAVWAWDLKIPPFDRMTQQDIGDLVVQGRAAICARRKNKIEKKLRQSGAKGYKSSKQKPASLSSKLSVSARGNKNRSRSVNKERLKALHHPTRQNNNEGKKEDGTKEDGTK